MIVGHNLAPVVERFLRREVNKGFAEVTGSKVTRNDMALFSLTAMIYSTVKSVITSMIH